MTNNNFQHSPPCGFVLWANKKEEEKKNGPNMMDSLQKSL